MFTKNGNILKINGDWLKPHIEPEPYPFEEVTIGTQKWMAKNLDIDDGGTGIQIRNNVTANGVNFGTVYYYTWEAANRIASNIPGWHLPNKDDIDLFRSTVEEDARNRGKLNDQMVKSRTGWDTSVDSNKHNIDAYGFNCQPVAAITYYSNSGTYTGPSSDGRYCGYWGSYFQDEHHVYSIYLSYNNHWLTSTMYDIDGIFTYYHAVRLIKDT